MRKQIRLSIAAAAIMAAACAHLAAQGPEAARQAESHEADHTIVYELGAVGEWASSEGFHPGGTIAFEVTPIEHWLELEAGISVIHEDGGTELPVDVLFKKPWPVSPRFEFMAGVGPEIVHATGRDSRTFWGIEAVLDFMFWPRRNIGWYVEPDYDVTFPSGTSRDSVGIAFGLLIGR